MAAPSLFSNLWIFLGLALIFAFSSFHIHIHIIGSNALQKDEIFSPTEAGGLRGNRARFSKAKVAKKQRRLVEHESTRALRFQEAWYIVDEAQVDEADFNRTYIDQDPHLQKLMRNASGSLLSFKPYTPPTINGTINIRGSGIHPILTSFRQDNETRSLFNPVCHRYRFPDLSVFPTISVIIPFQNERPGLLSMTVHSLLAQTPPSILKEIIVIDDNGALGEERSDIDEAELEHIQSLHPKIIWISNDEKKGCAGARLQGVKRATADVIMVVDSHVEMYSNTWAQHLLLPLIENPRTLAMQTLDIIDDRPGHERTQGQTWQNYGVIDDGFLFTYQTSRFGNDDEAHTESPPNRLPYETPFAPGSLFAIRRDEFWRLGGYDEGLAVWGGENVELTMKVWRCGFDGNGPPGRVVVVPCSRVGHVYRINVEETGRWPPPLPDYVLSKYGVNRPGNYTFRGYDTDNFNKLIVRNNMRLFRVWMGKDHPATRTYYNLAFGVNSTDTELLPPAWQPFNEELDTDTELARQMALKERNKCKSFDWFDEHIYVKLTGKHHPWHPSTFLPTSCGAHSAKSCGECPQGNGKAWCNGECGWCEHGAEGEDITWTVVNGTNVLGEEDMCVSREKKCRTALAWTVAAETKSAHLNAGKHSGPNATFE